jgi:hypothetical protein
MGGIVVDVVVDVVGDGGQHGAEIGSGLGLVGGDERMDVSCLGSLQLFVS